MKLFHEKAKARALLEPVAVVALAAIPSTPAHSACSDAVNDSTPEFFADEATRRAVGLSTLVVATERDFIVSMRPADFFSVLVEENCMIQKKKAITPLNSAGVAHRDMTGTRVKVTGSENGESK